MTNIREHAREWFSTGPEKIIDSEQKRAQFLFDKHWNYHILMVYEYILIVYNQANA